MPPNMACSSSHHTVGVAPFGPYDVSGRLNSSSEELLVNRLIGYFYQYFVSGLALRSVGRVARTNAVEVLLWVRY